MNSQAAQTAPSTGILYYVADLHNSAENLHNLLTRLETSLGPVLSLENDAKDGGEPKAAQLVDPRSNIRRNICDHMNELGKASRRIDVLISRLDL